MNFHDMNEAMRHAQATLDSADLVAGQMARMLRGRLRRARVDHSVLCELKRELAKFDMRTGRWKS